MWGWLMKHYFNNGGNCVCHNYWQVALFSSTYHNLHGFYVKDNNFRNAIGLYVARSTVTMSFSNEPNTYLAPKDR